MGADGLGLLGGPGPAGGRRAFTSPSPRPSWRPRTRSLKQKTRRLMMLLQVLPDPRAKDAWQRTQGKGRAWWAYDRPRSCGSGTNGSCRISHELGHVLVADTNTDGFDSNHPRREVSGPPRRANVLRTPLLVHPGMRKGFAGYAAMGGLRQAIRQQAKQSRCRITASSG